jgi:hypothetical protein
MSKGVLMCGGPANGRWVTVEDQTQTWEISVPDWTESTDPTVPLAATFHREKYNIVPVVILSRRMWVGVFVDDRYLAGGGDEVILKAVLQRDVAEHLGAYR